MKFANLIKPMVIKKGVDNYADFALPGEHQRESARRFEHMFEKIRGLYIWGREARRYHRKRIVIGVTTASLPDMQLMDEVKRCATLFDNNAIRVEAFNVYYFQTLHEFEQRIPGLGKVYQTPVVGVFDNGEWTTRATGYPARKFIQEYMRDLAEESSRRFLPAKEPKV